MGIFKGVVTYKNAYYICTHNSLESLKSGGLVGIHKFRMF